MKKGIIIGIVIVALVGGGFYVKSKASNRNKFTAVKIGQVVKGDVKSYLTTTAIIKSKSVKDYFGQSMKISKVNVKIGDSVKKDDVLVVFDVTDINNSIKQAEIQYSNAVLSKQIQVNSNNDIKNKIADLNNQIKDLDNQIAPIKDSILPQDVANVKTYEAKKDQLKATRDSLKTVSTEQFKQSDNAIALASITLEAAKAKVSPGKDNIVAEFDGIVTAVNVIEGGMGNPAQAAITIQDISNLKAIVSVGKYDAVKIVIGQPAEIKSGGVILNGKVAFIDPIAKKTVSATGTDTTLNTEIDITDKAEGLKIDFDTDINILLGEKVDIIKVPAESVKSDKEGRTYVFVIEGDKAVEKTVKLGLQSDMEAEILEGVKEGEKLILNPVASIQGGTLVKEAIEGAKK